MLNSRLTFRRVFSKYNQSFSDKLARLAYCVYKNMRMFTSKWKPLSDHEEFWFGEHSFQNEDSSNMPKGFNLKTGEEEDGYLKLKYIDFFDYLPKENVDTFKKSTISFFRNNKQAPFSGLLTLKDLDRIEDMGWYSGSRSFSNVLTVQIIDDAYLEEHASTVNISLRNLSPSYLVVRYRFYVSNVFNSMLDKVCRNKYYHYSDISRQYNTHWFTPRRFGRRLYTGNNARNKDYYFLISKLKWHAYKELKHYFHLHFNSDKLFLPTFQTYSTNIRPSNSTEEMGFWESVSLDFETDYAPKYNACVCWGYRHSDSEGICLSAYCGGDYSNDDHLPEIVQHDISDFFAVYMTATTLKRIALDKIAKCNKSISQVIQRGSTSTILKERVNTERKIYYSYRFINEFSDSTLDYSDIGAFKSLLAGGKSISELNMRGISERISNTKEQVDSLLRLLDAAADYGNAKSTMRLQLIMCIITLLSLFVALITLILTQSTAILNLLQQAIHLINEIW